MIVEFIGSTGAGKTTLMSEVQAVLAGQAEVISSFDLVATRLGLASVTHPTLKNLIQEAAGLPPFIRYLYRHSSFLTFNGKMLARHGRPTLHTISYLRSLERTLGMYEIMRRHQGGRIVLVDEGTLVPAHNIFVYTDAIYTAAEVARFASLAPLPDLVIYITAPLDELISRALRRTDPPRAMASRQPALVERYLVRAISMFEQLVASERLRDRVLRVDNCESAHGGSNLPATQIVGFIMRHAASPQPA